MNKKIILYFTLITLFIVNTYFALFSNLNINLFHFNTVEYKIFTQIRIPRLLATYFVGASLAVVGCVLQSVFLNPLCEGYTLGISSAAGVGVIFVSLLNLPFSRFTSSFLGVVVAMLTIYSIIFWFRKTVDISFVLAGIILNFFFSSLIFILTIFFDPYKIHYILLWLLGSFSSLDHFYVYISCSLIVVLMIILFYYSPQLDILILGKEKAISLGVNEKKLKNILIPICVVICALCVSLAGVISFVGIIVPNIMKNFVGLKHRIWIISSALTGAVFVSICDNLAKTLFYPVEVPVSAFSGIVGSVFFLVYLLKGNLYGSIKS